MFLRVPFAFNPWSLRIKRAETPVFRGKHSVDLSACVSLSSLLWANSAGRRWPPPGRMTSHRCMKTWPIRPGGWGKLPSRQTQTEADRSGQALPNTHTPPFPPCPPSLLLDAMLLVSCSCHWWGEVSGCGTGEEGRGGGIFWGSKKGKEKQEFKLIWRKDDYL